jgi:flagellar hook-associated protein 3 FlgL
MTRITQLSMAHMSLAGLQASLASVQAVQSQASSGKRIQVPSDDPHGTAISMQLRTASAADDTYSANISFANGRLGTLDSILTTLNTRVQQVRSIVINAQGGEMDSNSLTSLGAQIEQIKPELVSLYNTQYLGRPVFGGTSSTGQVIDDTGAYVGDDNPVMTRISAVSTVRVDVPGSSIGADKISSLMDQLSADVAAGNPPQADLSQLDDVLDGLTTALGNVGAVENRVTQQSDLVSQNTIDLQSAIATNEDADLASVLTQFSSQQVAYQTALGIAGKISQTSLLDFLQ